jgi:iron complex transport system ATP-binding protein
LNEPAIQLDGLEVRAGRRRIVSVGSLTVPDGQIVGVLGPNGAGKSTLLRCVMGLQNQVRGTVRVLGADLGASGSSHATRLRRRIGYVPQILPGHSEIPLTVREVVAIGRTGIAGLLKPLGRDDWRIIDQWIDRLGLSRLASRSFGQISGGEQRKTVIARAMAQQPELLLLDEPTANLDLGWREQIVRTIDDLYAQTGVTVLLVCHELEVLPACCQRVVLLRDGRVVADAEPADVLTTARVSDLYGPGLSVVERDGRWAVVPGGSNDAT